MKIKRKDITVDCEHCVYSSSDNRGNFEITVPIIDSETGISGPANLRCGVSAKGHTVELLEWRGFNGHQSQSLEDLVQRVSATLDFVAERRICGNRNICPSEVIQVVEENSKF